MTVCTATSAASGGDGKRRSGKASARSGATAATKRTWWNTRAENSAEDSAQSGETKIAAISKREAQPARALATRPRPIANASAASAAISSGSKFQRAQKSPGTAAGPQYAIVAVSPHSSPPSR